VSAKPKIIYTLTDEAPRLATYSLLPILRAFTKPAGIEIEESDISLAARILGQFPESLTQHERIPDNLADLSRLTLKPEANIIKLPNISAPVGQLTAAIKELQAKGYKIPDYPESPKNDAEKAIRAKYSKVLGSAVNPVLREGNSDRRAPASVKNYARKNPHSMAQWDPASRTHVAHMRGGDFYHGEKSMTLTHACEVRMDLVTKSGKTVVLRPAVKLLEGEVIDSMYMSKKALCDFFEKEIEHAKKHDLLFSLHVKATMMKVSHPIVFGHAVRVFYKDLFAEHGKLFDELGVNVNNGFANVLEKIKPLPEAKRRQIEADIKACEAKRPRLSMHQQPLQPQRRDRRRLDAGDDPRRRRHVGAGRQDVRDQGGAARVHFRAHLPGGHQLLQDQRRLRPEDHGHGAERRADGAAGGGVRLARQDLRDPGGWRCAHRR
jgi:isocitrate dehydrogenase